MKSYSSLIYFLWITFLAAPHCDCDGFMIDTHVMAKAPNQSEFELSGEAVDPRSCHPHCPRFEIPSAGSTTQPASGLAQLSLLATALIWLAFRARASGRVEQVRGPSRNRRILLADAGPASLLECRDKCHNLGRGRPSFRSATTAACEWKDQGPQPKHSF